MSPIGRTPLGAVGSWASLGCRAAGFGRDATGDAPGVIAVGAAPGYIIK
jgi:hypothetical protein